jgi:hypothetical protein
MTFEYLLVDANLASRKAADLARELNALGAEGWELVVAFGLHNQNMVFQRETQLGAKVKARTAK